MAGEIEITVKVADITEVGEVFTALRELVPVLEAKGLDCPELDRLKLALENV